MQRTPDNSLVVTGSWVDSESKDQEIYGISPKGRSVGVDNGSCVGRDMGLDGEPFVRGPFNLLSAHYHILNSFNLVSSL